MENKRKVILTIIIVIILVIMILTLSILYLNKKVYKTDNENIINTAINEENILYTDDNIYYYENNDTEEQISNILDYVKNRTDYFTVKSIVDNYISVLESKNKDTLKNILSPQYISKYNINNSNIFTILAMPDIEYRQYYKLNIKEMIKAQMDNTTYIYIVRGKCRVVGGNKEYDMQLMVELDTYSQLYNIYPYQYIKEKGMDKLKAGELPRNYTKEPIVDRQYNKFKYITITDKEMANNYFYNFKELLLYYQDDLYNRLNTKYINKKFGTKQEFQNYLNLNSDILYSIQINKYKVYTTKDYTDYICTDQYNNYYIFRQQGGIMRYTVFLDTYTVELDAFKEEYEKSSDGTKVSINIDKFKQMLNTKDYNAIYNKLNVVFRNNNFNNISKLKEYLQKNVYDINSIELNNYNQNEDYYVCECTLYNQKNTNEKKNMTIVMKLIDSNNFEMSFSMN